MARMVKPMMSRSRFALLLCSLCLVILAACGSRRTEPTVALLATFTPTPTSTPAPTPTLAPNSFRLVLTEAELDDAVAKAAAQNTTVPLSDTSVDLQPGQIVIGGKAILGFFPVDLRVTAGVAVQDGKAQPQIKDVRVNGSAVSGVVRQQVDRLIAPYLGQLAAVGADAQVDAVTITDTELVIQGRR